MVPGPVQYKRQYTLWVLIVLVLFCWPAALIYYFTREKVPVVEYQPYYAPAPGYGPLPGGAVAPAPGTGYCDHCGAPRTVGSTVCTRCGAPLR